MIAMVLVIVISDQTLSMSYVHQRILKSVRSCRGPWNSIRLHFNQASLLVHISRVQDQFRLRYMAVDTI